jgi:hypothetical protein
MKHRQLQGPRWGHTGYWKVGCQNRFSGKFHEAEHYRRWFKLTPSKLEGDRGWHWCCSGIYEQVGVRQRVHPGGWKTDPRRFFTGRLPRSTRKCTHNLRYGTRDQWPLRGVVRSGLGRERLCGSGETTSTRVPQSLEGTILRNAYCKKREIKIRNIWPIRH